MKTKLFILIAALILTFCAFAVYTGISKVQAQNNAAVEQILN